MFSNGKCSLTKRRDGSLTNSTKSARVEMDSQGRVEGAYSYAEKMIYVDHNKKYTLENDYKFSVTTSGHSWHLYRAVEERTKGYRRYSINISSLNDFDGTLKSLTDGRRTIEYTAGLEKFFSEVFKTGYKKALAKIKKDTEERWNKNREEKNRQARLKRLESNLKTLNYKSLEALKKAVEKYKEEYSGRNYRPLIYVSNETKAEKIEAFQHYITENEEIFSFNRNAWLGACIAYLNADSPATLEALLKEAKRKTNGTTLSINRSAGNRPIDELEKFFPVLRKYRDLFDLSSEWGQTKKLFNLIDQKAAGEVLGGLGCNEATA